MLKGFSKALKIFKTAAERAPAYKDFLKKNNIKASLIKTEKDFSNIPYIDKKNYLEKYPLDALFLDRKIPPMISLSSGSSGRAFYWPHGDELEVEGGKIHEFIFRDIFKIKNKKTLVIICFSMGTWVAGTYTAACCRWLARRGYNISIVTPGIDKEDILFILKDLAPQFDMLILAGYPPFLMDVVNSARDKGVSLEGFILRFLFAGENFTEIWRESIHKYAGVEKTYNSSVNIYGTADAAILGHETPWTVFLRSVFDKNPTICKELCYNYSYVPTIVQYYPEFKYFETVNNELVFTACADMPFVRYNIHDSVKLISSGEVLDVLKQNNISVSVVKNFSKFLKQPMLMLFGREDVSVTFYALNIYPENIKSAIGQEHIIGLVTGKFIAEVEFTNEVKNRELYIHIELNSSIKASKALNKIISVAVFDSLITLNSEYRKLYSSIGRRAMPKVVLHNYESERFKIKKNKHKWINR